MNHPTKQPPIDNAHVAPGCEPFTSAKDYQPTNPVRLAVRRGLTKFASTDAKLTDVENEIIEIIDRETHVAELVVALEKLIATAASVTATKGSPKLRGEPVLIDLADLRAVLAKIGGGK